MEKPAHRGSALAARFLMAGVGFHLRTLLAPGSSPSPVAQDISGLWRRKAPMGTSDFVPHGSAGSPVNWEWTVG